MKRRKRDSSPVEGRQQRRRDTRNDSKGEEKMSEEDIMDKRHPPFFDKRISGLADYHDL